MARCPVSETAPPEENPGKALRRFRGGIDLERISEVEPVGAVVEVPRDSDEQQPGWLRVEPVPEEAERKL